MLVTVGSRVAAQDEKCRDAVYNGSKKVHQQEGKGNRKNCIKDQTGNQDVCINGDQAKSTDQGAKLTAKYADKCATLPAFGVNASVADIINAAQDASDNVHKNKWGSPVDPDGSKCHDKISKDAGGLSTAQWKAFRKCVKDAEPVANIGAIEACIGTGIAAGTTAKGGKVTDDVAGACEDPIPNLANGDCGATPLAAVSACIIDNTECEVCLALNEVTGGNANCATISGIPCGGPPPSVHKCTFDGADLGDNSELILCLQGSCPFQTLDVSGAVDISCGAADLNGKRTCDCDLQTFAPVFIPGIGGVCVDPAGPCPAGEYDCDGGNALNVDLVAETQQAGLCTSNANCATLCAAHCTTLSKAVFSSACEGFCQGGTNNNLACDCDATGAAATCTCDDTNSCAAGPDTMTAGNCLGAVQGSCEGKDDERTLDDLDCHCQCIDESFGAASPAGTLQCRLGTGIRVETAVGCDGIGVLVKLPALCGALTSGSHTGVIEEANEVVATIGPLTSTGAPETCVNFDTSTTTGFELVTNLAFYDSTVGDLVSRLRLDCQ